MEGGLIAFVTSYHKGYSASGKVKTVHRYVPKEVSEIVVYYLWLVQPFVEILQILERGQSEFGSFLWEPEPEERWAANEDEEKDGEDDPDEVEEVEVNPDEDGEGGDQEEDRNAARNPDGYWGTDRVRKVMQRETGNRMGAKMGTSVWRHVYPAIQREFTCDQDVVRTLDAIYEGREQGEEPDEEARAKQSGHGRRMEEMIYGRSLMESPFHTMSERRSMRKVSVDWHRFLHFPSAWDEGYVDPESPVADADPSTAGGISTVEEDPPGGFVESVDTVGGKRSRVPGVAAVGVGSHYAARSTGVDRDANRRREEFVFYVAGGVFERRRHHRGDPHQFVAGGFERTMRQSRDCMRGMEKRTTGVLGQYCIGDPRSGRYGTVSQFYGGKEDDETVGSNRGRRMSHRVGSE